MRFSFLLLLLLISLPLTAQENAALQDLLAEAKTKLYSQPEQTGKIAGYIINQNESPVFNAEATLLLAKSFSVRGNYNEASKNALKAKQLAYTTENNEIKFESNLFALKLFRNLGLETVARKYENELILLKQNTTDQKLVALIEVQLKQDRAIVQFQNGNYQESVKTLQKTASLFLKIKDTTSENEANITLSEVLLQSGQLDSAEAYLKKLQIQSDNDFEKLQVLDITGRIYFNRKEYQKAVNVLQEALSLSLKLPSKKQESASLEGLTVGYLALEDTKKFFVYKQRANIVATQIETDKNLAINSVYNYINSYQKNVSRQKVQDSYSIIYILAGLLLFFGIIGTMANYLYASKTKEYWAIYKYISPKKTIVVAAPKVQELEKSSIVPEETEHILLQKLNKFESGKKYTNSDMSIALLASQFDTNTKYLSEVINRQKGKNFNAYINELRINYIIEKLKTDSVYFNYKVSYLAEESGFSSHSSFATVFKSITGISPTKFMDLLQKQETA